jgi:hypothetical protein
MAEHSIILRKTEEARLDQLYQTKCDEVRSQNCLLDNPLLKLGRTHGYHAVLLTSC